MNKQKNKQMFMEFCEGSLTRRKNYDFNCESFFFYTRARK